MVSMLPTVWLILVAAAFGGVLVDHTGMLIKAGALAPLLSWARGGARPIAASAVTRHRLECSLRPTPTCRSSSLGNLPGTIYAGPAQTVCRMASIAGSGSIFSPLIPWNVHGAFVAGTLGIAVMEYVEYAGVLFGITPIVLVLIGIAKFNRDTIPSTQLVEDSYGDEPRELPERRTSV